MNNKNTPNIRIKLMPTQIILFGFLALVAVGTLLLMLPVSSSTGQWTDPLTACFTSVSASCVTGLVMVDTATYWSLFGQIIILIMIQTGGLGFMSVLLILSMLIKRRVTPRESIIMAQSLGFDSYGGFRKIALRIVGGTFVFEFVGAVILSARFIPIFGAAKGIYFGIFHSVSAFCNAGFDLMGNFSGKFSSLTAFTDDPTVNITIMLLVIIGGIGFIVWEDVLSYSRAKGLSCYTKLVLITSFVLVFSGAVFTFFAESGNPDFSDMTDRVLASFFQSVSTRTAGFNTVELTALSDITKMFSSILMFIGGSAGSTAGGVKTATVALLVITAFQISGGKKEVTVFKRNIDTGVIATALSVAVIALILVTLSTFAICSIDGISFTDSFFECASALNTVGMSIGVAGNGHTVSKLILMLLMFCGRVGILTMTYSASLRRARRESAVKYPCGNIIIG
ncbi:MAG: Trk family potassium uptake protein [Ruminococcaceae bacterium]|nr:Trk family potassium uptake protein [Oscillospiraceae bacterium]